MGLDGVIRACARSIIHTVSTRREEVGEHALVIWRDLIYYMPADIAEEFKKKKYVSVN